MNLLKGQILEAIEKVESYFSKIEKDKISEIFICNLQDMDSFKVSTLKRNVLDREMILHNQEGISDVYIKMDTTIKDLHNIYALIIVYFSEDRGNITEKFKKLLTEKKNNL